MTRSFLGAGAVSVVATFWQVDDRAGAEIMGLFYKALLKGLTPAAALRGAQLELLRQGRWRNPYYWAAYGVFGDGLRPLWQLDA